MQATQLASSQAITIKRYVPTGNIDAQLKLNPSAKVFREIAMQIDSGNVKIELSSVTRETASGGYRNGAANTVQVTIGTTDFMTASDDDLTEGPLSAEPFAVITRVLAIRRELVAARASVDAVLALINAV
jgi:hypothetical protein